VRIPATFNRTTTDFAVAGGASLDAEKKPTDAGGAVKFVMTSYKGSTTLKW
jgi:hypothetical protein